MVDLSQGRAGTYEPRKMFNDNSPGSFIEYNLYLDASATGIWGNGLSGTGHYYVSSQPPNGTNVSIPVYAKAPARQNVMAGVYSDSVTVTLSF